MQMPGNYLVSTVQTTESQEACRAASKSYINSIQQGCAECKVQSFSCGTALAGDEKALWSDAPIPQYSVSSESTRVLFAGPEQSTKPVCDQVAREMSAKGMPATCVPPGQTRK